MLEDYVEKTRGVKLKQALGIDDEALRGHNCLVQLVKVIQMMLKTLCNKILQAFKAFRVLL